MQRLRAVVATLAVVTLAACSSTSAPSSSSSSSPSSPSTTSVPPATTGAGNGPLTAAAMKDIVLAAMATNTKANAAMSLWLLGSYEAGSAYAIDAAGYDERATARSDCDFAPFGFSVLETTVLSTAYPRRFAALGSQAPLPAPAGCHEPSDPCPRADSLFVFQQSSPRTPWRIVLEPSANSGRVVELANSGPVSPVLPAAERATAGRLPSELAGALARYGATGRLGALTAGDFGTSCWVLPDPHTALVQSEQEGVSQQETFAVAPDEVPVPLVGGHALAVFTLTSVTTLVPRTAGGVIGWIVDPASDPVSGLLAAGDYTRIVERSEAEVAVEATGAGTFRVVGAYAGVTSVSGTKVQSPTTTGGGGSLVSVTVHLG